MTTGAWVEPEPLATGAWVEPAPDVAALPAPSDARAVAAAGGGPGGSGGTNRSRFCFPASPSVDGVGCAGGLFGERSGGDPCGCFCGAGVGFLGLALPYGDATTPFASSLRLFEALSASRCALHIIERGGHFGVFDTPMADDDEPALYPEEVVAATGAIADFLASVLFD